MATRLAFASFVLFLALLSGCATEPTRSQLTDEQAEEIVDEQTEEVLSKRDVVICRYEVQTGSHFRTKRCRTVQQIADERRESRDALERHRGGGERPGDR